MCIFGSIEVLGYVIDLGAYAVLTVRIVNGDEFTDEVGLSSFDVRR